MNFPSMLIDSGYTLAEKTSIFMKPAYAGIAYSDGDETENRIANIISKAQDLSIFSRELAIQCTDWPSLYHLSGTRANILRPFHSILKQANVLEIGAGCGAITRYLGESGANVLALEGSPRRAAIARSRTRDLENVSVVADKFDQFQCDCRFDIVTLIGVLEYAALFTDGEDPVVGMLTRVRELLKPEGRLILAIENQLGLKYFAGAAEDHTGEPMLGIEGRYTDRGPRTFGRKALKELLERSGFLYQHWMVPFPDYKLPVSILTEQGLNCDAFDSAAFCWQNTRHDPQLLSPLVFSPELVWPVVDANDLTLDLANSFLVGAQISTKVEQDTTILAYHYSTNGRHSNFCKETLFVQKDSNNIELLYNSLSPDAARTREGRYILFNIPPTAKYVYGESLALQFLKVVTRDNWSIKEVGDLLKQYIGIIESYLAERGKPSCFDSITSPIPGICFDIIPQNIICLPNGMYQIIDQEWSLKDNIPLGWILFRTLLQIVSSITRFGKNSTKFPTTRLDFFVESIESAGFSVTIENLKHFAVLENKIQTDICYPNNQLTLMSSWNPEAKNSFFTIQKLLKHQEKCIFLSESKIKSKEDILKIKNEEAKKIDNYNSMISAVFYVNRFKLRRIIKNYSNIRIIKKNKLFCSDWYIKTYPDVKKLPIEPLVYYLHFGYTNTNPNPYFDSLWYINTYNDVRENYLNPLVHYILFGAKEGRNPSPYFHTDWYLNQYDDVKKSNKNPLAHFLLHGAKEGRNANPYFNSQWYKETYKENEFSEIEPLLHYMTVGWREGKSPSPYFNTQWYLSKYTDVEEQKIDPLVHYMLNGYKEGRYPNPLFNSKWYATKYPEFLDRDQDPLLNYMNSWASELKNPNELFDIDWYLSLYPDVKERGIDPLIHYMSQGVSEGRNPCPTFHTKWYLEEYHDVRNSGINPLEHYIHYGHSEGRKTAPDPARY